MSNEYADFYGEDERKQTIRYVLKDDIGELEVVGLNSDDDGNNNSSSSSSSSSSSGSSASEYSGGRKIDLKNKNNKVLSDILGPKTLILKS